MKKKEITIEDLAVMVQRGFMDSREYMDKRFEQVDKRFEQVDKRFDDMDNRFERLERRMGAVEDGQIEIKVRLDDVAYKSELKNLEKKIEKRFLVFEKKFAK